MKNKISVLTASVFLFAMPIMVFAQIGGQNGGGNNGLDGIGALIGTIGGWVRMLLPILLTLGVLAFFWGLTMYLFKIGKEEGKKGREIMIYGILAVFVMASIGGIVSLLQRTTGTASGNDVLTAPCIGDCPNRR